MSVRWRSLGPTQRRLLTQARHAARVVPVTASEKFSARLLNCHGLLAGHPKVASTYTITPKGKEVYDGREG